MKWLNKFNIFYYNYTSVYEVQIYKLASVYSRRFITKIRIILLLRHNINDHVIRLPLWYKLLNKAKDGVDLSIKISIFYIYELRLYKKMVMKSTADKIINKIIHTIIR